jgi:hypothetical protein
MPDLVFFSGFSDENLKTTLESQDLVITSDWKKASWIIFEEDPNRRRYRLPPRTPTGVTRAEIIKNIRKSGEKQGWQ